MTQPRSLRFSQVIGEAIAHEMESDPKVLVLGEDVGGSGGVFAVTRHLQERFGEARVRDTPISEMAFTGMGVGLAMAGYRPIVEIMFVDFIGACLEQVMNAMSKIPYMSGGNTRVPMVLKTAGGCIGSAAQHSQCLWGMFAHLPGMVVVCPSSPYDYKGLMAAAIQSDDPVVFMENKRQLNKMIATHPVDRDVPDTRYVVPLGKAKVVREGSDLTIVTVSASVADALGAAGEVEADGISVEVVDLRTLVPLDMETVARSVAKTGRLLVVDEDYASFGLSGEIIGRVVEALGPAQLRQVRRHCMPDIPLPAAITLEQAAVPSAASITRVVREMS
jgi:acetoin:2,6-dichlorophenolindophenol oxidoreductase subunit beta